MLVRACPVLIVFLAAAGGSPYSAQSQSDAASDTTGQDDLFDDDLPVEPTLPPSSTPDADVKPPAQDGAEVEPTAEAAPEPEAVTAKLAIRDALDRKDAPAAERLFQTALKQFPDDSDFREVQRGRALLLHEKKARELFGRTLADGARLFGRQWEPGLTMQDGETAVGLAAARRGSPSGSAAVDAALAQGYAYINRGDPARAEKVLTGAIRGHDDHAELYYARVLARCHGSMKKSPLWSLKMSPS